MKRLETLLPHLKPGKIDSSKNTFTLADTSESLALTPLGVSFLGLCNGSYSIKEICVLVFNRESSFSFLDIYQGLNEWSHRKIFKNSDEIMSAILETPEKEVLKNLPVSTLDAGHLLLALRKVSLFSNFSEQALKHIISISKQEKFNKGQKIVHKGAAAQEAFVVLQGQAGVFLAPYVNDDSEPLARLPTGSLFGESSALPNQKRTADVIALCDSQLLRIPVGQVSDPELSGSLSRNLRLRLMFSQMIKTHPLFKKLPNDGVQLLLSGCRVEKVPSGTTVIQQGDEGQDFYFILSGQVLVIKDHMPEANLKAGAYFGEMGGLLKQTRSASVVADSECIFLILSIKNFISILAGNLNLAMDVERTVFERQNKIEENLASEEKKDTEDMLSLEEPSYTQEITLEIEQGMEDLENFDFSGQDQAEE
jgi:CRP-like cAMP-binding protein